jgi:hypothetical protein
MVLRTVFLPKDLDNALKKMAFQNSKSKNDTIRQLVLEALTARGLEMDNGRLVPSPLASLDGVAT